MNAPLVGAVGQGCKSHGGDVISLLAFSQHGVKQHDGHKQQHPALGCKPITQGPTGYKAIEVARKVDTAQSRQKPNHQKGYAYQGTCALLVVKRQPTQ